MERAVQPPGLFSPPPQQQQQQQPAFAPGTAIHPPGAVPRTPAVYPPPGSAYPQYHHELNNPIQGPFTTTAAPLPHRGPERNPQIEPGFYQESSSPAWGPISPAQSNGTSLNGTGPSPGLGTPTDDQESNAASPDQCARRQRKKQKRNKPTLSCYECVDRKTKVRFLQSSLIQYLPLASRSGPGQTSCGLIVYSLILTCLCTACIPCCNTYF
jgi:hypothetical protein